MAHKELNKKLKLPVVMSGILGSVLLDLSIL